MTKNAHQGQLAAMPDIRCDIINHSGRRDSAMAGGIRDQHRRRGSHPARAADPTASRRRVRRARPTYCESYTTRSCMRPMSAPCSPNALCAAICNIFRSSRFSGNNPRNEQIGARANAICSGRILLNTIYWDNAERLFPRWKRRNGVRAATAAPDADRRTPQK